jgi:hypothetical protein
MTSTDVMIEYGPVEIGGKTDYCPVKSVSIVKAAVEASLDASERPRTMDFSAAGSPHWTGGRSQAVNSRFAPQQTLLDDITFAQYHVFRAESRIVRNENPPPHERYGATPIGVAKPNSPPSISPLR